MASSELQQLLRLLRDDSTTSASLRRLAEQHDLNPDCRRKCDLCIEFCEFEFEYSARHSSGFTVIPLYFIGDAIVNHVNCDPELHEDLINWLLKVAYGDWTHSFEQAAICNPRTSPEQLLKVGKETVIGYELLLVKEHPNMTKDIEKAILLHRQWKRWPKKALLIDNLSIDVNDHDFESIRI